MMVEGAVVEVPIRLFPRAFQGWVMAPSLPGGMEFEGGEFIVGDRGKKGRREEEERRRGRGRKRLGGYRYVESDNVQSTLHFVYIVLPNNPVGRLDKGTLLLTEQAPHSPGVPKTKLSRVAIDLESWTGTMSLSGCRLFRYCVPVILLSSPRSCRVQIPGEVRRQ